MPQADDIPAEPAEPAETRATQTSEVRAHETSHRSRSANSSPPEHDAGGPSHVASPNQPRRASSTSQSTTWNTMTARSGSFSTAPADHRRRHLQPLDRTRWLGTTLRRMPDHGSDRIARTVTGTSPGLKLVAGDCASWSGSYYATRRRRAQRATSPPRQRVRAGVADRRRNPRPGPSTSTNSAAAVPEPCAASKSLPTSATFPSSSPAESPPKAPTSAPADQPSAPPRPRTWTNPSDTPSDEGRNGSSCSGGRWEPPSLSNSPPARATTASSRHSSSAHPSSTGPRAPRPTAPATYSQAAQGSSPSRVSAPDRSRAWSGCRVSPAPPVRLGHSHRAHHTHADPPQHEGQLGHPALATTLRERRHDIAALGTFSAHHTSPGAPILSGGAPQ